MTAGEAIAAADALRPNQYTTEQKLQWLQLLDGQIRLELFESHEGAAETAAGGEYTGDTELLAPQPYGGELYTAYLFSRIDLANAEIQKYNQSAALVSAAWRQLADRYNREHKPLAAGPLKF